MKHIMGVIDTEKAWCGETISIAFGETPFKTLEHAAMNGLFPTDPPKRVCKNCVNRAIESLLSNNSEVHNDEQN